MRFLSYFFLVLTVLCGTFWFTDAPGSGMAYPTVGFAVLYVLILCYLKYRTGFWFTDSSGGK